MTPGSWTASELFSHCADLPASEREALLDRVGADRPEVADQVRRLLKAHDHASGFLEQPAIEHVSEISTSPERPPAGFSHWIRSRPRAFWLFLAVDLIGIAFYIFVAATVLRFGSHVVEWGFDMELVDGNHWRVSSVDDPGPAAGKLVPGDDIIAMNEDPRTSVTGVISAMFSARAERPYKIRVARNAALRDFTLMLNIRNSPRRMGDVASFGIVSLAFFFTAVLLGFLRSDQRVAQRAYWALLTEALVLAKALLTPYQPFLHGAAFAMFETFASIDGIHFALGYLFYCTLFDRVINTRRWMYALYVMFPAGVMIGLFQVALDAGLSSPLFDAHPRLFIAAWALDPAFYVAAPIAICAVIARNYFKVTEPDDRRRARWIAVGSLAGIVPYILVRFLGGFLGVWTDPSLPLASAYQDLRRISILAAMLIPAATGYAIYKHRLFDIRVVVRRGVRYVLAKSVLQTVLALPALGLVVALIRNAHRTVADAVWNNFGFVVLLALLAAVLKFRVPLRRWLDRRFFRENYRQEQILLSLIDSVQKLHSLPEMAETVGASIEAAFHPERLVILFRAGRDRFFIPAFSAGGTGDLRIRDNSPLLAMLESDTEARQLASIQGIPPEELRRFDALGIDVVVPMASPAGGIAGLILLGRKRADEPYAREDRRLLAALGSQMAMVCENISLHQMLTDQHKATEDVRARLEAAGVDAFRECPRCGRCYDLKTTHCPHDGKEPVFSLPIPRTVDRYRLDRLIGKGGMGAVYEAEDLSLRRRVAIKVMTGRAVENATSRQRIHREARAVARLNHPNIIATYDFGFAGDVAYLVMELVAGETLRAAIHRGRSDAAVAAAWIDQLLAGVGAAHRAGIVHRDLKPENVLISTTPDGGPLIKILDFGVAKTDAPEASASITRPGTVLGSIQYMSPEQFNGARVDARSDLFSVGVIVYELLTGSLPFTGNTYTERILSVLRDEVALPPEVAGGAPLEAALKKCLAKDPEGRFSSAEEARSALVPLIAGFQTAGA